MLDTRWTLFDGRAGDDTALVWLEAIGGGAVIGSQSWGPGVEANFGFDTIETVLRLEGAALSTLAHALVMDRAELDPSLPPIEVLAAAYRGDSAATSHARRRLEELSLTYEFQLR